MWRVYLILIGIAAIVVWPNIDRFTVERIVWGVVGFILVAEVLSFLSKVTGNGPIIDDDNDHLPGGWPHDFK